MARKPKHDYAQAIVKYHSGSGVQELAAEYGITRESMIAVLARNGITDRSDHDRRVKIRHCHDDIAALYEQGLLIKDISKKFNCSEGAVSLVLKAMGVKIRKNRQSVQSILPDIDLSIEIPDIKPQETRLSFREFQKDISRELRAELGSSKAALFDIDSIEAEGINDWLGFTNEDVDDLDY